MCVPSHQVYTSPCLFDCRSPWTPSHGSSMCPLWMTATSLSPPRYAIPHIHTQTFEHTLLCGVCVSVCNIEFTCNSPLV